MLSHVGDDKINQNYAEVRINVFFLLTRQRNIFNCGCLTNKTFKNNYEDFFSKTKRYN